MTSMSAHPTWPARSISTGRGPALPSPLSRTIWWPDPVWTVKRRPVPSYTAVEVLVAIELLLGDVRAAEDEKGVDRSATGRRHAADDLSTLDDESRIDGEQFSGHFISRKEAHGVGRAALALCGVEAVMADDQQATTRRHRLRGTRIYRRALVGLDVQIDDDDQIE